MPRFLSFRHSTCAKIFVTSDEEDVDPDGVIDYKFGEPEKHRLLRAMTEVTAGEVVCSPPHSWSFVRPPSCLLTC